MRLWECRRDAFLFLVSVLLWPPWSPGSGWLCFCSAEIKPVEFLHRVAWVPSAFVQGAEWWPSPW